MSIEKQKVSPAFVAEIKEILAAARQKAYAAVNFLMVETYWRIGRRIVEEEQHGQARADYATFLIRELSISLTAEFGKGFGLANLWNFRQFYLAFPEHEKLYALRRELTWTHYRLIMRVQNPKAREYYMNESAAARWTSRQLERNINSFYFERRLSEQTNALPENTPVPGQLDPREFLKDPYVFEFLNLPGNPKSSEKALESALLENLRHFLLELGRGFSFVGRQFRISTETAHFYIDLVFYNYLLKCFVLLDLKTGALTHQDIGQMDMYRRLFDDLQRPEGDNPTIGIILCTEKNETIVRYSIMQDTDQLFAAKYKLYLPSEEELIAEIEREKTMLALSNPAWAEKEGGNE